MIDLKERIKNAVKFGPSLADQLFLFDNKDHWAKPDRLDAKIFHLLDPHGRSYFSPLRPMFLFEIKSLNMINCFSLLMARDGVWSLLNFFYRFSHPERIETILLINQAFAYLVPEAWLPQVAFYSYFFRPADRPSFDHPPEIFLIAILDPEHCSLPFLERELRELITFYGKEQIKKIKINCLFIGNRSSYYFPFLQKLFAILGTDNIACLDFDQLTKKNLSQSVFYDFNEHNYYYSDSYLLHYFLSRGGQPFNSSEIARIPADDVSNVVDLSVYHGINITDKLPKGYHKFQQELRTEINELNRFVFKEEMNRPREQHAFEDLRLSSPEFDSLTRTVGKRLKSINAL